MTNKQIFIKEADAVLSKATLSEEATAFWADFKSKNEYKGLSENAQKIFDWMKANKDSYDNAFTAKQIAEGTELASRAISGFMLKLKDEKLVAKVEGSSPTVYQLV